MRKQTWFTGMVCLLALALTGVVTAAPLPDAQQKAMEAQSRFTVMTANTPVATKMFGTPTSNINLDELDEILFSDSFDYTTIQDAVTAGWTLSDGSEDGNSWVISSETSTNHLLDDTAPFLWVDSDGAGGGVTMDEYMTTPAFDASGYNYLYIVMNNYMNTGSGNYTNSGAVEISVNGTDWTEVQYWAASTGSYSGYPFAMDISEVEGDLSSMQVRFHFWDDGSWGYYWGVDELTVIGSDEPADFQPPQVTVIAGPSVGFEGQNEEILAIATDDVNLVSVTLSYGLYAAGTITELTSVEMSATLNEDEFSGIIPGSFASIEDTVVFAVTVVDGADNEVRDPVVPEDWYGYVVYSQESNIEMVQLPDFEWIDITGTGTNLELDDDDSTAFEFSDYGFESFPWYGEEYTQFRVTSNGWMSFGPYSGGTVYTTTMPNMSTPNAIIAPCGADLDPSAEGSGNVWVGMSDGKLVLSWEHVYFYNTTAGIGPHMQIVLDPVTGVVQVNYQEISGFLNTDETPYTRTHVIGYENGTGTIGYTYYQGSSFEGGPSNESSWLIARIGGSLAGHVYELDGETPIAEAEINVWTPAEPANLVAATTTDLNGAYGFPFIPAGTYNVEFIATDHITQVISDVTVASMEETVLDVNLAPQEETTVIGGYVFDADSDVEDDPIEGINVHLVQLDLNATTDANGFFTFGEQTIGTYRFDISFSPVGTNGYHDASYPGTVIVEENPNLEFTVNQILPPRNLTVMVLDAQARLSWNEPLNHETTVALTQMAVNRREMIRIAEENSDGQDAAKIDKLRAELVRIEANLALRNGQSGELDEISDFDGYRVMVDDDVLEVLVTGVSYTLTGLTNGTTYQIAVAADYGYGEEYLVFTAPVSVTPEELTLWFNPDHPFEWVDITEIGTPLNLDDDGESAMLNMGGMTFVHYGIPYTTIRVGANGGCTFLVEDILAGPSPIPDTGAPNALIAVDWEDFDPADHADENVYYHVDAENSRIIVQWHTSVFPGSSTEHNNLHDFELILYPETGTYIFSYQNAETWLFDNNVVGLENEDGTEGFAINAADVLRNNNSISLSWTAPVMGTITGTVLECSETGNPIEGAEVLIGTTVVGTTAGDGTFSVVVPAGNQSLSISHDDYWTSTPVTVLVPEDGVFEAGIIVMTKPDPAISVTTLEMVIPVVNPVPTTSSFELANNGCGPLEYTASVNILNAANQVIGSYPINTLPSDFQVSYEQGSALTKHAPANSSRGPVAERPTNELDTIWQLLETFETVTITGSTLGLLSSWIDGTSAFAMEWQSPYTIYEFNFAGEVLGSATPNTNGTTWWNESEYDPTTGLVYTIASNGAVFVMEANGSNATQIASVGRDAWAIAHDFDNAMIYWADGFDQSGWGTLDMESGQVAVLPEPPMGEYPYAMMYLPNAPDGYTIIGAFNDVNDDGEYIGPVDIYGYNPTTTSWSTTPIQTLFADATEHSVSGMTGTMQWSASSFDMIIVSQGDAVGNLMDIYEGTPLQTWLTIDPTSGTIESLAATTFTVTVDIAADDNFNPEDGQNVNAQIVISGPHMANQVITLEMGFTSAGESNSILPAKYALYQNYPNPFNPSTAIKFDLIAAQNVKLTVFNMLGQEVARLADGPMQAGSHNVSFDASRLASGVYLYRLETPAFTSMKKMVLVK